MDIENKNPQLKNRKVFLERRLIFGIPDRLFFGSLAFSVAIMLILSVFFGLLLATFLLVTFYYIHKDDPCAFDFYLEGMRRESSYVIGEPESANMFVLEDKNSEIEFSPLDNHQ